MVIALAALLLASAAAPAWAATALLPDLLPFRSYLFDAYLDTSGGRRLLRFSGTFANKGAGTFELRGEVGEDGNTKAYQRIYHDDGSVEERYAGEFEFNGHEDHNHFHYAAFGSYRLRLVLPGNRLGPAVAVSEKVGFAMFDNAKYDLSLPGAPPQPVYARPGRDDPPGQPQGISVGWADLYDRSLEDQWIDVFGVPDGEYWLEKEGDAQNLLLESDDSNNVTWVKVALSGASVFVRDELPSDGEPPPPDPAPVALEVEQRAYPNPWRADAHGGSPLVFAPLAAGDEVVLYTLGGQRVRTLTAAGGEVRWDLSNDSGEAVAAGGYFFVIRRADGGRVQGRLAVLR